MRNKNPEKETKIWPEIYSIRSSNNILLSTHLSSRLRSMPVVPIAVGADRPGSMRRCSQFSDVHPLLRTLPIIPV
ncbi:hypothetical protein K440DRAFT_635160 [Wilcoxina mikolae CBS 423.85]|nr:hypothetical protein K440DRAFT_635160 [Wilcoxina mikolae CBS 423.85]